jgi:hypothetical protein
VWEKFSSRYPAACGGVLHYRKLDGNNPQEFMDISMIFLYWFFRFHLVAEVPYCFGGIHDKRTCREQTDSNDSDARDSVQYRRRDRGYKRSTASNTYNILYHITLI